MISKKNFNFFKIINYLLILLSLFLITYTFYRAEIVYESKQLNYYLKYYLLFLSSLIFWIFVLWIKNPLKKILLINGLSIITFLYVFEFFKFYNINLNNLVYQKKELSYIKNEKLILLEKLKKENINVSSSFIPNILNKNAINFFPLAGVSNIKTVFCKEGPEFSVYQSDRYGFNNPDNEWSKKIENILIGDSFVQGACVKEGEDISSKLRLITKTPTLGLGMAGNGPLLELATLREYVQDLKVKNIFWLYFERNDLDDLKSEKENKLLLKYLNDNFSQGLIKKQKKIDNLVKKIILEEEKKLTSRNNVNKKKNKKDTLSKIIRLQIVRDKSSFDRGLDFGIDPLFIKIISQAKNFAEEKNSNFFFIYLPDKESFRTHNLKKNLYKKKEIFKILKKYDVNIIDINAILFEKAEDPFSLFAYRTYGHYSAETYVKIAEIIKNYIKK